jgi:hypothetical protein
MRSGDHRTPSYKIVPLAPGANHGLWNYRGRLDCGMKNVRKWLLPAGQPHRVKFSSPLLKGLFVDGNPVVAPAWLPAPTNPAQPRDSTRALAAAFSSRFLRENPKHPLRVAKPNITLQPAPLRGAAERARSPHEPPSSGRYRIRLF